MKRTTLWKELINKYSVISILNTCHRGCCTYRIRRNKRVKSPCLDIETEHTHQGDTWEAIEDGSPRSGRVWPSCYWVSDQLSFSHLPSVEVISSFHDIEDRTKCWEEPLDLVNDKSTHIHNLRPFNYDPARTSPLAIAQQNEQEFVVESINGHRGNRQRRSTMEFKASHAIVGSTPA